MRAKVIEVFGLPAGHRERAGADELGTRPQLLDGLGVQDRHGVQQIEDVAELVGEPEHDLVLVGGVEGGDRGGRAAQLGGPQRVGVGLDRELDVLGRERTAGVEGHVVPQVQGQGLAVGAELPRRGQAGRRLDLVIGIPDQEVVGQPDDGGDAGVRVGQEVAGDDVGRDPGLDRSPALGGVGAAGGLGLVDGGLAAGGTEQGGADTEGGEPLEQGASAQDTVGRGRVGVDMRCLSGSSGRLPPGSWDVLATDPDSAGDISTAESDGVVRCGGGPRSLPRDPPGAGGLRPATRTPRRRPCAGWRRHRRRSPARHRPA